MTDSTSDLVSRAALSRSMRDFRVPKGDKLLSRVGGFFDWQDERRRSRVWPFSRAAVTGACATVTAKEDSGRRMRGVNFASQDYLSLASHREIKETAIEAVHQFGVHSAGSAALVGNSASSIALERKIGEFLLTEEVVLYPTGWGAGFGAIKGLVRSTDHVVLDALSHSCLQEGVNAATRNIHMHRHLDVNQSRPPGEDSRDRYRERDHGRHGEPVLDELGHAGYPTAARGLPRIQRHSACRRGS
jgi:glycine C-acetyltransferase